MSCFHIGNSKIVFVLQPLFIKTPSASVASVDSGLLLDLISLCATSCSNLEKNKPRFDPRRLMRAEIKSLCLDVHCVFISFCHSNC